MGKVIHAWDGFKNFVANLGTRRDKQSAGEYTLHHFTYEELSTLYRTSWMAAKLVDIPAEDATREWREWHAEQEQIEAIEAEERRLLILQKVAEAVRTARLYRGAAIYASIRGDDPLLPLDPNTVKQGALEFVTVLPCGILTPGEIELDPMLEGYGKPKYYEVAGSGHGVRIHPSRLSIFIGKRIPWSTGIPSGMDAWGDSVLQATYEAVRNADSIAANIASLVYEAKIDVLQIPNLTHMMNDPASRDALTERVSLAAVLKGNNGVLVLDKEEEYTQKTLTFTGLTDINAQALQAVSGAADIPVVRFLAQSPGGLNSTGESDLRNYYDSVASDQENTLSPAMHNMDEVLIRSALGTRPPELYYEWKSLWQITEPERADIGAKTADTIDKLAKTALFDDEKLAEASVNLLSERGIMPGLELRDELGEEEERAALGGGQGPEDSELEEDNA